LNRCANNTDTQRQRAFVDRIVRKGPSAILRTRSGAKGGQRRVSLLCEQPQAPTCIPMHFPAGMVDRSDCASNGPANSFTDPSLIWINYPPFGYDMNARPIVPSPRAAQTNRRSHDVG
jgi:hypothetical protein